MKLLVQCNGRKKWRCFKNVCENFSFSKEKEKFYQKKKKPQWKMIEVELRSFISKEQYDSLLQFFQKYAAAKPPEQQTTYYFDGPHDLRIQKNNAYSKVWLKKGALHDDAREEIEIRCDTDAFENLERLFSALGYGVAIKWFRQRHEFDWEGVSVCLDCTRGYGYIIEFEKLCEIDEKDSVLSLLHEKCKTLGIELSSKAEFEQKFRYYKEHWRTLTSDR